MFFLILFLFYTVKPDPKYHKSQLFFVKTMLLFIFLIILFSCNNNSHADRTAFKDSIKSNAADSVTGNAAGTAKNRQRGPFDFDTYQEQAHLDLKNYYIKITSGHFGSDNADYNGEMFPQRNLLIVRNKRTNMSDTTLMETSDYLDGAEIVEQPDSLRFKSPLLEVNWSGDSDIPMSEFVGYWHDTLRSLFTLDNLVSIVRKDEWTLTGFTCQRDEIIYQAECDYPFTVSLKEFEVGGDDPPVQYIGWHTKTLEPVRGYKMISAKDSIRYTIKEGVEVQIDTFYRAAGRVILILPDSTKFHTKFGEVKSKLQQNTAG